MFYKILYLRFCFLSTEKKKKKSFVLPSRILLNCWLARKRIKGFFFFFEKVSTYDVYFWWWFFIIRPSAHLDWAYCASVFWVSCFFFFFPARMNSNRIVHAHRFTVQETKCIVHALFMGLTIILFKKNFKIGPTALFTHLKIICYNIFSF